jgi:glucosyl-3-phosphoglycerate synthase
MVVNLARINKIPGDWGLEVGTGRGQKNTSINRVCQVDIDEYYEHKHQELSPEDASTGSTSVRGHLQVHFRTLASDGIVFYDGFFKTLFASYARTRGHLKRTRMTPPSTAAFRTVTREPIVVTFIKGIKTAAE